MFKKQPSSLLEPEMPEENNPEVVAMVAVEGGSSSSSHPQPQPQGERPRQTLAEWICMSRRAAGFKADRSCVR